STLASQRDCRRRGCFRRHVYVKMLRALHALKRERPEAKQHMADSLAVRFHEAAGSGGFIAATNHCG
ncbi:MAG: hypothetical protein ACI91Q_002533, partial [Gammaproteobacteria bacterium]